MAKTPPLGIPQPSDNLKLKGWYLWYVTSEPERNILRDIKSFTFAEAAKEPAVALGVHPSELSFVKLSKASLMWILGVPPL